MATKLRGGANQTRHRKATAKLEALPEYEIILGLKGVIDFACWKGIIYARSWPRYTGYNNRHSVTKNQPAFAYIKQQAKTIDASTTAAYTEMIRGTQRVYSDQQVSVYYAYDIALETQVCYTGNFERTAFDECTFS